jgi:hypothetical protein
MDELTRSIPAAVCLVAIIFSGLLITIIRSNNESAKIQPGAIADTTTKEEEKNESSVTNNTNAAGWKCACEGGGLFLPPSLMKSIGGPAAMFKVGAGSCYHKDM